MYEELSNGMVIFFYCVGVFVGCEVARMLPAATGVGSFDLSRSPTPPLPLFSPCCSSVRSSTPLVSMDLDVFARLESR